MKKRFNAKFCRNQRYLRKNHEISSFKSVQLHVDRCKFNQLHYKYSFQNLKNRQNLTFWPKKRISYGTGQKLTPEKSPGLETRFSHNK